MDAERLRLAGHDWKTRLRKFTVRQMKVGSADGTGQDAQTHFPACRLRQRTVGRRERTPRLRQHHGDHAGRLRRRSETARCRRFAVGRHWMGTVFDFEVARLFSVNVSTPCSNFAWASPSSTSWSSVKARDMAP